MQQKTCNRPNLYHLNNRFWWLIIVVGMIINMMCDKTLTTLSVLLLFPILQRSHDWRALR